MNYKKLPLLATLIVATILIVGCGNDTPPNTLSAEDQFWVKQQRIQQMYGGGNTTTTTSTQISYVTITNTTTVRQ